MTRQHFLHVIDWFVPPEAKTDGATLGRARIFAFSHVFGPVPRPHDQRLSLFRRPPARAAVLDDRRLHHAFWLLPFGLKWTGKLPQLALFSVTNLTFVTLFGSYYYGGVSSPFLPWLLTALLLGFFYLGERPFLVLSVFALERRGLLRGLRRQRRVSRSIFRSPTSRASASSRCSRRPSTSR